MMGGSRRSRVSRRTGEESPGAGIPKAYAPGHAAQAIGGGLRITGVDAIRFVIPSAARDLARWSGNSPARSLATLGMTAPLHPSRRSRQKFAVTPPNTRRPITEPPNSWKRC
jgi:hypothetical protein